jgi:DME family drug/metabolite transporter
LEYNEKNLNKRGIEMMDLQKKGFLEVFAGAAIWGSIGLFVMVMDRWGSSAALTSFLRSLFAAGIMLVITIAHQGIKSLITDRKTLVICALLGLICQGIYNIFYCLAITSIGVTASAVLLNVAPLFVAIEAHLLFHEKMGHQKILALLIDIIGCILAVTGGTFDTETLSIKGIFLGIGAGFCYSLTSVIGKIAGNRTSAYVMSTYSYLFSALFLFFFVGHDEWGPMHQSGLLIAGFFYALIPTCLAYLLYYSGVQKITENSLVPVIASVETVVATLFGIFLYGETHGPLNLTGIVFVLLSIALLSRKQA